MSRPTGDYEAGKCPGCTGYKHDAAMLMQPFYKVDISKAYSSKDLPTYTPLSLREAGKYFVADYVANAARQYGTTSISDLRKNLGITRVGLSNLVNNAGAKENLNDIRKELENTGKSAAKDSLDMMLDPIARSVVEKARTRPEGYDIKQDTAAFKRTYVNNMVRAYGFYNAQKELGDYKKAVGLDVKDIMRYGIKDAASVLDISERRVIDLVKDYYSAEIKQNIAENKEKAENKTITPDSFSMIRDKSNIQRLQEERQKIICFEEEMKLKAHDDMDKAA